MAFNIRLLMPLLACFSKTDAFSPRRVRSLPGLPSPLSSSSVSHRPSHRPSRRLSPTAVAPLFAKRRTKAGKRPKPNKTVGRRTASSSGFGGAATEPCPCGSSLGYMKCCGEVHKSPSAFASASAERIVRARYSAYAKREVDFIIASTHPRNERNFMADVDHWRKTIETNCYDNFELKRCDILSEAYEGTPGSTDETAFVKFVATMVQVDSREKTAFMETSTFQRAGKYIHGGAWLYKDGVVEQVPVAENETMESGDERDDSKVA